MSVTYICDSNNIERKQSGLSNAPFSVISNVTNSEENIHEDDRSTARPHSINQIKSNDSVNLS